MMLRYILFFQVILFLNTTLAQENEDISTLQGQANLIGTSLSFSPSVLFAGDPIDLSGTILNNGAVSTINSFYINFYLSEDPAQPNFNYLLGSFPTSALNANESRNINETGTVESKVQPGQYYVWMSLDPLQNIPESNENDNRLRTNVLLTVEAPPLPNLVGSSLSFDPDLVSPGDPIDLSGTVLNSGNASTNAGFQINFFLSQNPNQPNFSYLVHSFSMNTLGAGASRGFNRTGTIPEVSDGSYYVWMSLDVNQEIAESNEGDNRFRTNEQVTVATPCFAINRSGLDFDDVLINKSAQETAIVTNCGSIDLTVSDITISGSDADDFTLTTSKNFTLRPNRTNNVTVEFEPNTTGQKTATLSIHHNGENSPHTLQLMGRGVAPDIAVSPESVDFGQVNVENTESTSIEIENTGTADLVIDQITLAGQDAEQFGLTHGTLPFTIEPQNSDTFEVMFTPQSDGTKSAEVIISHNALEPDVIIPLSGEGVFQPVFQTSATTVDFDSVLVDTTRRDSSLTVSNPGRADLIVTDLSISGPDANQFLLQSPNSLNLAPGESTDIILQFTPNSTEDKMAVLIFTHNAIGSPDTVSLTGTGFVRPNILVTPSESLDFGSHLISHTVTDSVLVENAGGAALMADFELSGQNAADFQVSTPTISLPPGNSMYVPINFSPLSEGDKIADLIIDHNAPNSPSQIVLTGRGVADVPPDIEDTTPSVMAEFGSPIQIIAQVTDNVAVSEVNLLFRQGGRVAFAMVAMNGTNEQYVGTIPDTAVGTRGVEYFIEATDNNGNTDSSEVRFFAVQLRENKFTSLFEGANREAEGEEQRAYRLISFPLNTTNPDIESTLLDDLGQPDSSEWRLWEIDPDNSEDMFPFRELFQVGTLAAGDAKFLISRKDVTLTSEPGTTVTTISPYSKELRIGWNMFSSPFDFDIPLQNLEPASFRNRIYTYREGSWINGPPLLQPGEGYMFKRNSSDPDMLTIHPSEVRTESATFTLTQPEWQIQISASCRSVEDKFNFVGVAREAANEWDAYERCEPPPIGNYISLVFPRRDWKAYPDLYTTDFRPAISDGEEWTFEVKTNQTGEIVALTFAPSPSLSAALDIKLLDLDLQVEQDLRRNLTYHYRSPDNAEARRFALLVGGQQFIEDAHSGAGNSIPDNYELTQNFPNPFNPSTSIKFGLPQPGEISLKIYNIRGMEIATLVNHQYYAAGQHAVVWDAHDNAGRQAASGVYFYILTIGNEIKLQNKMTLLK